MDSVEIVNSILSARDPHFDAFQRVLPEIQALDRRLVRTVNVDSMKAVSRVLGAFPRIMALRGDIERTFRDLDFARFERLELYACAFLHTHLLYSSSKETPAALRALAAEGDSLRVLLKSVVTPLVDLGLIDKARIESCQRQPGYKTIATDLGVLASVLLSCWPKVGGMCYVTEEQIHRALAISEGLLRLAGERDMRPERKSAARDLRNRGFTLMADNYEEARRAISYVRWHVGDVEDIAPSLSGGRHRSAKPQDDQQTETPTAEVLENAESAAAVNGTEVPSNQPFLHDAPALCVSLDPAGHSCQ